MARFIELIRRKFLKSGNKADKDEASSNRNSQLQYEVKKAPRAYDEVELPDEEEQDPQDQYKVDKKPRSYDDIELPDENDRQDQFKVKKQPRSYEEITLDNEDAGGTSRDNS